MHEETAMGDQRKFGDSRRRGSAARAWSAPLLLVAIVTSADTPASDLFVPDLYRVTTETVMPHLEENLRYAITHEARCFAPEDLATGFPVLTHPALEGCLLEHETRHDDVVSYTLVCDGAHGTTGNAVWELGERRITGTLNVRLGGKNMTFYQRMTAELQSSAAAAARCKE
jgi:hypothetical protein